MVELSPIVRQLTPGLLEVGKIKIGRKGSMITSKRGNQFQPPEKLDHFIVTTLERDPTGNFLKDKNIHRPVDEGGLGDMPRRIPITLLFDSITKNFQCRYVCFHGKTLWCSGDGEKANRQGVDDQIPCPCERCTLDYDKDDKCKINSTLSVMIRDARTFGGIWKFRSTSYNSAQSIYTSLYLISQHTKGILSGIDLDMVLAPKTVIVPNSNQSSMIYVVGIEYVGTMHELREASLLLRQENVDYFKQVKLLESAVDETAMPITPDEYEETIEEYYPEQVDGYVKPKPPMIDLGGGATVDTESGEVIEPDERTVVKGGEFVPQHFDETGKDDDNRGPVMPGNAGQDIQSEMTEPAPAPEPYTKPGIGKPGPAATKTETLDLF